MSLAPCRPCLVVAPTTQMQVQASGCANWPAEHVAGAEVCLETLCIDKVVDSPCAHFARRRRVKKRLDARSASMARWAEPAAVET